MRKVDFEFHFYIPEAIEALSKKRGTYPWYDEAADRLYWSAAVGEPQKALLPGLLRAYDDRIKYMDEYGLDAVVLSSAPGVDELGEDSVGLCRKINDNIYDHMQKYPGRFYGSAILPMHDVNAAIEELKRCVEELGFVGWHCHSVFLGTGLEDDKYIPLLQAAERLGVYIYLHPRCSFWDRLEGFGFNLPGSGHGFAVETQTTIIKMILKGFFDQMPDLKVMLGHYAEGLPFFLERMSRRLTQHKVDTIKMEKDFASYFKTNIWTSTSGNMSKEAFMCTKAVMGIDRMVIGTDTSFENAGEMISFLDGLDLTEEERALLYYKNAEQFTK